MQMVASRKCLQFTSEDYDRKLIMQYAYILAYIEPVTWSLGAL